MPRSGATASHDDECSLQTAGKARLNKRLNPAVWRLHSFTGQQLRTAR
jgi:hypothetical protein